MARSEYDPGAGSAPFSAAVVAEGRFAYVSGQGAMVDGAYTPSDIATETAQALANIAGILTGIGSGREHVVRCGVFLADIADIAAMNEVYSAFFAPHKPARTTVQVAALPNGFRVEIDCVALLP
jgi:2-iminobutanoate/2-iminopropanoate deaminase